MTRCSDLIKKVCQTVRISDPTLLVSLQQAAPDQVTVQPSLPAPPSSATTTAPSSPQDMVTATGLSVHGRRITNTSERTQPAASTLCGLSSKVIMVYTRHKSAASFICYESIKPAKATQATNLPLLCFL